MQPSLTQQMPSRDRHLKVFVPSVADLDGQPSPYPTASPVILVARRVPVVRVPVSTYRSGKKRIRPLPPVPYPTPKNCGEKELPSPPSSRPLPTPPSASKPPANRKSIRIPSSSTNLSVPQAANEPPSPGLLATSITPSQARAGLTHQPRKRPKIRIHSLKTNFSSAPSLRRANTILTPLTPSIPVPPSPITTKRRRIAKLQRHLGESIPPELVFRKPATKMKLPALGEKAVEVHVRVHKVEVSKDNDDNDGSWVDEAVYTNDDVTKRFSRKWLKERAGRRWVEADFQKVLGALRAL